MAIAAINAGMYGTAASMAASTVQKAQSTENVTESAKEGKSTAAVKTPDVDTFEKSSDTEKLEAYEEPKRLNADQLKQLQEDQMNSFNKMLDSMLNTQADKAKLAGNGISADLFKNITVTPEQKAEAQKAISEDGEWGVDAVATRIMDMVVSLSGGDSSKASELKAAVDKGFKEAAGQWGTSLPEISQRTHDEINRRFDYWEKNGTMDGYQYKRIDEE